MRERKVVWESCGYFPLFAIPLKSHHYTLFSDSITVRSGITLQKTHNTKLHNIITKEMMVSPIAKLFHCGKIRLITWGSTTPDLEMWVKNPDEVFRLIEETKEQDHQEYMERKRRNGNYAHTRYNGKNRRAP